MSTLTLLATTSSMGTAVSVAQEQIIRFGASLSLTGRFVDNARLTKDGYDFWLFVEVSG